MKMVIWSAAMLATAAGAASAKDINRETSFVSINGDQTVTPAAGSTIVVPLNNVESRDAAFAPGNVVINVFVGAGAQINGFGFTGTLTTIGPSWVNEFSILMTDSALSAGIYAPVGFFAGGPGNNNGNVPFNANLPVTKLLDFGYSIPSFTLGVDGMLRLEFYEYYDDAAGFADGFWNGDLTIQYVPTPGTFGLLGLAGVAALGRKRRA